MRESDRAGKFDHLFSEPVRETIGETEYGSWRAISSSDAVPLHLGYPFPDSLPNEEIRSAVRAAVDVEPDRALQYGGGDYADRLTDVVAERARQAGIDCTADQVVLANGATHAIDTVCRIFLDPGDTLFTEAPTFMGALNVFENYSVDIEGFDVDSRGLDVDAVAKALAERETADRQSPTLLYTIPTFQNPTGTTLSLARRKQLLELAEEYDFVVLEDDAYRDLRYDGDGVPTLRELDDNGRVVRVGTFSKTIAPGVRTGWIIADSALIEQARRLNVGGKNFFTRSLLGYYCTESDVDTRVSGLRQAYERRRDRTVRALADHMPRTVEWTDPSGGFFVWLTLPDSIDSEAMLSTAADEGVLYLPGPMFFPEQRGSRSLRLSFSYVPPDDLERGIQSLARTIRSIRTDR